MVDHGHSHGGHSHGGHSHGHSHSHGEEEATKPKIKHVHSHAHASPPTDRTPLLASSTSSQSAIVPAAQSKDSLKETNIPVASSSSSTTADDEEAERNDLLEEELFVHPEEFRGNIVKAAQDAGYGSTGKGHAHGRSKSISSVGGKRISLSGPSGHAGHNHDHEEGEHHSHEGHDHGDEEAAVGGHGHDGEMNMRGVFLHVLGDAVSSSFPPRRL